MKADLHTHTTASDGTASPTELVDLAASTGLDVLGLTDHDSAAGWEEATARARQNGVTLLRGMEISTRHRGAGVHLLAYLPDPTYPPLADQLSRILEGRSGRLPQMVTQLRTAGLKITEDDVLAQVGDAPAIGRPHVADALVALGVVADRTEAFDRWLRYGKPGYVDRYAPSTTSMIELVVAAGGAPVIAHPWGRGSRRVLDATTLADLAPAGLVGLEVHHQDHDDTDRVRLGQIAADLDLVATGSSDFHGDGKTNHDLGCNLTAPDQLDRLLAAAARNGRASGRPVPDVVGPLAGGRR